MKSLIRVSLQVKMKSKGKAVEYMVRPKEDSVIFGKCLLNDEDMPDDFHESYGFIRTGETKLDKGTVRQVLQTARVVVPLYFAASQGNPILWVCSKKHTLFYESLFSRRGDIEFTVLRGSLRGNNPYPPLSADWGETGSSDDEHIIMLAQKRA